MYAQTVPPVPLRARAVRVPYVIEVTIRSEHTFWTGFTQNLTDGGVFLATPREVAIGTIVEFELRLPDTGAPWTVRGEVRWTRAANAAEVGSPPGCGVRFIDLDPDLESRIVSFMHGTRDAMFFDEV